MPVVFGPYELGELLGRGGMGEVFRAYDTVRDRTVALKVLPQHLAQDESFTARFRRESRLAAQLNEAHIIPIHDFGEIDGRLFIDMRLVEGQDLSAVLESRGALPIEVAVEIIAQLASALDAAHERGLVHRDVKPSNVLLAGLRPDPAHVPFAYLVDFGIARAINSQNTGLRTTQGTTVGTIAYMAPERIAGEPGNARVDIYAMACVLYEALTGTVPYKGETFAMMYAHVNAPVPRAGERVAGIPVELDDLISRGLAKSPDDRFATAGEFAMAAQAVLRSARATGPVRGPSELAPTMPREASEPTGRRDQDTPTRVVAMTPGVPPEAFAPPPEAFAPPPRAGRRRRSWIAAALVLLLAVAAGGVALLLRDSGSSGSGRSRADPLALTPRAEVKVGGTLTWAITSKITNFNPFTVQGATRDTRLVTGALLPSPFHFDRVGTPSVDTDYFTSIAQISANPMKIEYKINPKAQWSDGTKITYADFLDQQRALATPTHGVVVVPGYDRIASVSPANPTDDQDVIVTFDRPFSDWQNLFSPLLPKALTSDRATFAAGWPDAPLVTAGPFRWGGVIASESRYTITRDVSWRGARAMLESITFVSVRGPTEIINGVRGHHVGFGVLNPLRPSQIPALTKGSTGVEVRQDTPTAGFRRLVLNAGYGPLRDIAVRQAIALALDRRSVAQVTLGDQAVALQNHFFNPGVPAYQDTCGEYCTPDVARAKALLEQDGWRQQNGGTFTKDGAPLSITINVPANTMYEAESDAILASLGKAGIKVTFAGVLGTDFPNVVIDAKYQMTLYDDIGGRFPLSSLLLEFRHGGDLASAYNRNGAGSAAIDTLLDQAEDATSSAGRDTALNKVSAAMWTNATYLPLYSRNQVAIVNSSLVNVGAFGLGDVRWADIGYRA